MIETLKLKLAKVPFTETDHFSSLFLDYLGQKPDLKDFIGTFPKIESFGQVIEQRTFEHGNRPVLVKTLNEQYRGLALSERLEQNIGALEHDNCFTVTTGHQLNIFTGPLFFIYKIVSTINICTTLKKHYPQHNFVPVFWMASEDHDFAEINHFNLFGQEYCWDIDAKGAVGRLSLDGMADIVERVRECPDFFKDAYLKGNDLADATRKVANHLFGDHGLVVVDADDKALKQLFVPVMKDDLINHSAFRLVSESSDLLEKSGYKTLVTPREINLFYLEDNLRERIVKEDAQYKVLDTELTFSEPEMLEQLEQHPDRFSPNVVMRTLYQETILPNLAYVGGPGELSYWMQFKSTFEHYKIPFPVLFPRNNVLMINKSLTKKFAKLEIDTGDLFLDIHQLKSKFVKQNADTNLELNAEKGQIRQAFQQIFEKIKEIDGSLTGYLRAEENKVVKNIDQIEKRLKKAEENNQEIAVSQLEGLKEKLFPEGNLQERHQNFLNFYINNPRLIEDLLEYLNPFDFSFHVLLEDG